MWLRKLDLVWSIPTIHLWIATIHFFHLMPSFCLLTEGQQSGFRKNTLTLNAWFVAVELGYSLTLRFYTLHFISIIGLGGNRIYIRQSLQLRKHGFWVWRVPATINPSKISLSQFCIMSTFHMARALLTETMLIFTTSCSRCQTCNCNKSLNFKNFVKIQNALESCFCKFYFIS